MNVNCSYRAAANLIIMAMLCTASNFAGADAPVLRRKPAASPPVATTPTSREVRSTIGETENQQYNSDKMSQQQIDECTNEIKQKQVESQSWGGDVDAAANRLGKYQKELFEGRCAGHPEAQAYLAGANKMLGYGGESSPVAGANLVSSMSFIPALTGPQVSVVKTEMAAGTGGPEYVRIQSNKKCAAYKITETPDAVSKFKKVVFGIKNTCDIPMYIRWEVYEGKHLTNMVDYPNQLDLTPSRNAYFKPGETLISKPFSVSSRDPVKIVFNQVCPIESEASRMAGKPLGNIHARPEQPDLCIGLVLKPADVPTAK